MTNPDYTAVALVVDRSGSMSGIAHSSSEAINEFIKGQAAAEGKRSIFLAQFDDHYEVVRPTTPADAVIPYTLEPRGSTALFDAIGKTILDFGRELKGMREEDRPGHVVIGIMTDGGENASQEFTAESIKEMITEQETKYGWNFLFMGANQDAVMTGKAFGMKASSSITYGASGVGTRSVLNTMSEYVAVASCGLTPEVSDEDRKEAMG